MTDYENKFNVYRFKNKNKINANSKLSRRVKTRCAKWNYLSYLP